ncbi:MAG: hypothetical protein NKF70_05780 [Methanobacterium sp. ERen5]|nr:MAG: hypothetical protein NKF70_05780 [Methanobacterium sp. ERen5]
MHINRLSIIGLIMIVFSLVLIAVNTFDKLILELTYSFLMGSSKGKSIIFFMLMGSLLIFSQSIQSSKFPKKLNIFNKPGNYYLKILIIIISITYVLGLLIEIWIRLKFGVSIFTTFVSTSPQIGTSSIIHSHVYKSMLGILISDIGLNLQSNIHTAISIAAYIPRFAAVIFVVFPIVYILGVLSTEKRPDIQNIILIFAITTTMIGMLDGGLFSAPAMVGLAGLLGIYSIKKPFSPRVLVKPSMIIVLLLILRIFISFMGSSPDVYEITILGEHENVTMTGFNVINERTVGNNTMITVPANMNEFTALNTSFDTLKDKYHLFFVSWDSYSFFRS